MQPQVWDSYRSPRNELLGYRVTRSGDGRSVLEWTPGEAVRNPLGIVHGGFVGVMIDDTCGTALVSTMAEPQGFPTVSMHIDFLRGIPVGQTHLCEGRVLRSGRRLAVVEATISSGDGKLLARGTCTFALGGPAGGDRAGSTA